MPTKIDVNVNNIIFESYSVDPTTGHPIYVFDSSYLPSSADINDPSFYELLLEKLMDKLIARLPSSPFSLVVFSSGFSSNDLSWVDGLRMYSRLPKHNKNYLQKMYIVHESFFIRTLYQVLKNVMNIKFLNGGESKDTLVHASSLSDLAEHIDITKVRISLNVYLYDYEINDTIRIPDKIYEKNDHLSHREYRQLIFDKIFKRLRFEAPKTSLVFQKPGSYKKIKILLDVIERKNYVDLSQWDIYSIGSVFLHFIKNKSKPLFPIDLLPLPIEDSFEYTHNTFFAMMSHNSYLDLINVIFPFLLTLVENNRITNHTYMSLSRCLASSMCKEKVSIKSGDRLAIGTRYIRNLLMHYQNIQVRIAKNHNPDNTPKRSQSVCTRPLPNRPIANSKETLHHQHSSSQHLDDSKPISVSSAAPPPLPRRSSTLVRPKPQSISVNTSPSRIPTPPLPARGSPRKAKASTSPISSKEPKEISPPVNANLVLSPVNSTTSTSVMSSSYSTSPSSENDLNRRNLLKEPKTPVSLRNRSSNISLRLSHPSPYQGGNVSRSSSCSTAGTLPSPSSSLNIDFPGSDSIIITDSRADDLVPIILKENIKHLTLDNNEKIQTFDQELRKKRLETKNVAAAAKFSPDSYSDIPSGNKVSKLATLYEQRLLGLQIVKEVRKD